MMKTSFFGDGWMLRCDLFWEGFPFGEFLVARVISRRYWHVLPVL